jgi:hypothetical protein
VALVSHQVQNVQKKGHNVKASNIFHRSSWPHDLLLHQGNPSGWRVRVLGISSEAASEHAVWRTGAPSAPTPECVSIRMNQNFHLLTYIRRTSIARGALLRGLEGSVVKIQRSRRHYGVEFRTRYIPGKGGDAHKVFSWTEERWLVPGSMRWYVNKVRLS